MGFVSAEEASKTGKQGGEPKRGYSVLLRRKKDGTDYYKYYKDAEQMPARTRPAARTRPVARREPLIQLETVERMIEGTAVPYKIPRARKTAPLKLTAEERRLYNIVMEEKNAIRRAAYALSAPKPCKGDKVRAGKQGIKGRKLLRCVKPPGAPRKRKKPKSLSQFLTTLRREKKPVTKVRAKKIVRDADKYLAALGNF